MRKILETGIILFSVMGFWGMIYPDLCFTEDVCSVAGGEAEDAEDRYSAEVNGCGYYAGADTGKGEEVALGTEGQGNGKSGISNTEMDMFTRICFAKPGQIRIKSKFLEAIGLGAQTSP